MTDAERHELKGLLMQADLSLKQEQSVWKAQRDIAILAVAIIVLMPMAAVAILARTAAAITAATIGTPGYKICSQPQRTLVNHVGAPLSVRRTR
jgi:hypothetical protein